MVLNAVPSLQDQVVPYFGLKREPFSIAPDPHFLFMSEMHREALAHLLYGVSGGGGFVLLTGEIGAGKTTVCRCFLEQVPDTCNVAYIVNPKLTVVELLTTVCDEFGIALPARSGGALTVKDCLDPLNAFVLAAHAARRNNLLVIDEAQSLSADVLEQLRLLTNLETAERKLLQIVLIGQPELRDQLARPGLEQLAQRVIARYHLPALSADETARYVHHRLAVAGLQGEGPFDDAALRRVHRRAGGVPRRINLLCGRALLGAYALGRRQVSARMVDVAAREVFDDRRAPAEARLRWGAVAAGMVIGGVLVAVALQSAPDSAGGAVGDVPTAGPAGITSAPAGLPSSSALATRSAAVPPAEPAPAVPATPAAPLPSDTRPRAIADEAEAWRELATLWGVTLPAGDPCAVAGRQQLQCFRGSSGLGLIRQLDRPVMVVLRDGETRRGHALLVAVGTAEITLRLSGGALQVLPLAELARLWRGEFATFWRVPPGYAPGRPEAAEPALLAWLAPRLPAGAGGGASAADGALRARLESFQLAQGLKPDGLIGPLTLMQLNRASGVAEPRLQTER